MKKKKELLSENALHHKAQDTIIALCKIGSFHKTCGFVCYMGEYKDHLIGIMVESYCCIFIYDKENSKSLGVKDITGKTFDDYRKEIIKRYGNQ